MKQLILLITLITTTLSPGRANEFTESSTSPPTAPSNLALSYDHYTVNLTWSDNSSDESGFIIYRRYEAGSFEAIDTVVADIESYNDRIPYGNSQYAYYVTAYIHSIESSASNQEALSIAYRAPTQPSNVVLEALSHAEVKITFSNPDSTSWSIGIYRADSPSGKFEYVTHASLSSNEYFSEFGIIGHPLGKEISVIDIDPTLDESTTYYYKVYASAYYMYSEDGPENNSALMEMLPIYQVTTLEKTPNHLLAPSDLLGNPEVNGVYLLWKNNEKEAAVFEVHRALSDAGPYSIITEVANNRNNFDYFSYYDSDLDPYTTYYYKIRAVKDTGFSNFSVIDSTTTYPVAPVLVPIEDIILQEGETFSLEVKVEETPHPPAPLFFRLESYHESAEPEFVKFTDHGNSTGTLTITPSIGDGGVYQYTIDAVGLYFQYDVINFTITVESPLPKNLSASSVTSSSISLTWESGDVMWGSVELQRKSYFDDFETITEIPWGITEYTDENLDRLRHYTYRFKSGISVSEELTVLTINNPPVLDSIPDYVVKEGEFVIIELTASDPDEEQLNFFLENAPDFITLVDKGDGTATLNVKPKVGDAGVYEDIWLVVADYFDIDDQHFNILVEQNPHGETSTILYRVNSGYTALADTPIDWSTDIRSSRSPYYNLSSANITAGWNYFGHTNTTHAPDVLFGSHRIGYSWANDIQYNFPVDGLVSVTLFFAERESEVNAVWTRAFNIIIEGIIIERSFDIFKEAGRNAIAKTYHINVTDGSLDIILERIKGNPIISGIEVRGEAGSAPTSFSLAASDFDNRIEAGNYSEASPEGITVFPNPFHEELKIALPSNFSGVEYLFIVDQAGKTVFLENKVTKEDVILLTQDELKLAPGFYFLTIKPHNAPKRTFKMIKQ